MTNITPIKLEVGGFRGIVKSIAKVARHTIMNDRLFRTP